MRPQPSMLASLRAITILNVSLALSFPKNAHLRSTRLVRRHGLAIPVLMESAALRAPSPIVSQALSANLIRSHTVLQASMVRPQTPANTPAPWLALIVR